MLSGVAKTVLTATALAPVGLCYAWVAYFEGQSTVAVLVVWLCLFLIYMCNWILTVSKGYIPNEEFKITSAAPADGEAIAMLLVYLLPLFTAEFTTLNWGVWMPALMFIALLTGTGHCFNFNPLLRIMGWHFFSVHTPEGIGYLLITKKKIKDTKNVLTVKPFTEYIMVDTEE